MRLLPRPLLSVALIVSWVMLARYNAIGVTLTAIAAGVIIPILLPNPTGSGPCLRPLIANIPEFLADMSIGWAQTLRALLRGDTRSGTIVTLPHGLRRQEARSLLAWVMTLTGGTLACEVTDDTITLHCAPWHGPEHAAVRVRRYARQIGEVFA